MDEREIVKIVRRAARLHDHAKVGVVRGFGLTIICAPPGLHHNEQMEVRKALEEASHRTGTELGCVRFFD